MNAIVLLFLSFLNSFGANVMDIHEDCVKTYSSNDAFSLCDLKSLYALVEKKKTRLTNMGDRSKADLIVWIDSNNNIHFRPLLTGKWIRLDGAAVLDKEIDSQTAHVRGRKLKVYVVLDPKSTPEKAGNLVQLFQSKAYLQVTLIFGK